MKPFDLQRPDSLEHADQLCIDEDTAPIAGGTNLVDLLKLEVETPATLVDISRLPMAEIAPTSDGGLRIGALASNTATAVDGRVRSDWPVLARAILAGATQQLRNRATTGGNLCQRTRCYYFTNIDQPCNKREPGSGCGAIKGVARLHAVLGTSDQCIATYPGDMAVALAALDATVEIAGPGKRLARCPSARFTACPETRRGRTMSWKMATSSPPSRCPRRFQARRSTARCASDRPTPSRSCRSLPSSRWMTAGSPAPISPSAGSRTSPGTIQGCPICW